jgi:hypothetical protein
MGGETGRAMVVSQIDAAMATWWQPSTVRPLRTRQTQATLDRVQRLA